MPKAWGAVPSAPFLSPTSVRDPGSPSEAVKTRDGGRGSSGSGVCWWLGELTTFLWTLPPLSPGSLGPLQCYGVGPLGDLNCSWEPLGDLGTPSTLYLQSQK